MSAAVAAALLLALSLPANAPAATQMLFTQLGAEENLSQGSILAITQDTKGFLWFGTEDGLNRFDGYDMTRFIRDRDDRESLPSNWVAALAQDRQGRLWIGTAGGGVVWRDQTDGRFHRPVAANGKMLVDPRIEIRVLYFDQHDRLWIGTRNSGLRVVNTESGEARDYRRDLTNSASLSDDSVFAIEEDTSGAFWIATQAGVDRFDPSSGNFSHFGDRLRALAKRDAGQIKVQALRIDERGIVWMGTDAGLARLDPVSGTLELLRHGPADSASLPDDNVNVIFEDDEQRLWIGTAGGLALIDRRTDRFTTFRNDPAARASLPDNHVVSLYQDRSGLLWVGTKSGGLARWNPRSWSFGHSLLDSSGENNVTSFAVDNRGTLWVGTLGGGLVSVNRATGQVLRYRHNPRDASSLGDDNVMALVADDADRIWVGTMRAGVERLDSQSGRITRLPYGPDDPNSLGAAGVMSLLRDSQGRVWVGTYGGGLARIDPVTDRVIRYPTLRTAANGLSNDRATALAEDSAGLIWIGTDGGGLNVLDPTSGRFRHYLHAEDDPHSLSANTVYAVQVDERGSVWVGSRGGGLDRAGGAPFGARVLSFENFSERNGLPNSTVYGIESDPGGHLWLSTNRGLARFSPNDKSVRNFGRSHGLQGDEFNFGAHFRSPAGELFFGGPNGYNAFFADRLRFNEHAPPLVLTSFLKFNSPVDLDRTHDTISGIHLGYKDDVVTFRFAALDFTVPEENRYAYELEGFDKGWVQAGTTRQATYTNLSGGRYVFRVRGANSDGKWNEEGLAIHLYVAAPPWQRWWAYLLYAGAFALALFAVWAGQQRNVRREAAYAHRLAEEVGARTAELGQRNQQLEEANRQLEDASVTDPLTGLGNRRFLRNAMNALLAAVSPERAGGAIPHFMLMVADLDNLKPINDQHGHEAGDRVLVQVAEILKRLCRTSDLVVRWGGDEFVLLCRGADLSAAALLAERIRTSIAKQIFRVHEGLVARVSCSLGFAPYPFIASSPDSVSWEQTLALADAALYQAKVERNHWVGWGGTPLAAELPQLLQAIERDAKALERQGILDVRRRPLTFEDTVDKIRAAPRGGGDTG